MELWETVWPINCPPGGTLPAASCSPTLPCPDINHHQGPCFEKLPVDHNALTRPIYPAVNLTFRPLSRQGRLGWEYNGPAGQVAREWGHSEGFCPTPRIACTRWLRGPSCHRCHSQGHATPLFIGRGLFASIYAYKQERENIRRFCITLGYCPYYLHNF